MPSKVFIVTLTSGYIYEDQEFKFSSRIKVNDKAISIYGKEDFYLDVFIIDEDGTVKPCTLPSTLFKGYQENDCISFMLDGSLHQLQLSQLDLPNIVANTRPQDRFEQTMMQVKQNISARRALYTADLNGNYLCLPHGYVLHGPILTALANEEEHSLTEEEFRTIPKLMLNRKKVEEFSFSKYESPNKITINAPGLQLRDIHYLRSNNLLYVWARRPKNNRIMPEVRVITITDPKYFQATPKFSISGTGLLFLEPNHSLIAEAALGDDKPEDCYTPIPDVKTDNPVSKTPEEQEQSCIVSLEDGHTNCHHTPSLALITRKAGAKTHEKPELSEIYSLLDSYLQQRTAVIDCFGKTKEYFYGSFFSYFQKSFTQKTNAIKALKSVLNGNKNVSLSEHLSTLRNGKLGQELQEFIKSGKADTLLANQSVRTLSDFIDALENPVLQHPKL